MASLWTKFSDIFSRTKSGVVPQAPSGTGTTKYLREDGTWAVPSGGGGGGASALADLEDVNITEPTDGQLLTYNATAEVWENADKEGGGTAADISYDGTQSGLAADTVQEAIDELASGGGSDLPLTVVDGKLCVIYEEV